MTAPSACPKVSDMNFTKLVPNIFYHDINEALKLFVDCLEFRIEQDEIGSDNPFCVVSKNDLRISFFQNAQLASEHNPEFRLVTEDIQAVYKKISSSHPEFLHSNLSQITLRPWGAKEFAIMDRLLGIIIQE